MRAMILAAGRGERMRPLTDNCPKPLIPVNNKPLIVHHIEKLAAIGVTDIVINLAWLGDKIIEQLGDGAQWQVNLHYSDEQALGALETAGGIIKALPLLCNVDEPNDDAFLVINGDVFTEFNYQHIIDKALTLQKLKHSTNAVARENSSVGNASTNEALPNYQAHLWLIENPIHNTEGDFSINNRGGLANKQTMYSSFTFSGIGLYTREFFINAEISSQANTSTPLSLPLGPMLRAGADNEIVSASLIHDYWQDVGTPERLHALNTRLKGRN